LNNDPTRRPSLDEILSHPWLNNENTIPRCLPPSTLACPPSNTYIRQFINPDNKIQGAGGNYKSQRPNTDRPEGSDWKQVNTDRNYGTAINTERQPAKVIQTREAEVWVKKWVDYSTKYGLGYYLSNEVTGVFFNDSTKIILDPNGHHIDYMERRSSDK